VIVGVEGRRVPRALRRVQRRLGRGHSRDADPREVEHRALPAPITSPPIGKTKPQTSASAAPSRRASPLGDRVRVEWHGIDLQRRPSSTCSETIVTASTTRGRQRMGRRHRVEPHPPQGELAVISAASALTHSLSRRSRFFVRPKAYGVMLRVPVLALAAFDALHQTQITLYICASAFGEEKRERRPRRVRPTSRSSELAATPSSTEPCGPSDQVGTIENAGRLSARGSRAGRCRGPSPRLRSARRPIRADGVDDGCHEHTDREPREKPTRPAVDWGAALSAANARSSESPMSGNATLPPKARRPF